MTPQSITLDGHPTPVPRTTTCPMVRAYSPCPTVTRTRATLKMAGAMVSARFAQTRTKAYGAKINSTAWVHYILSRVKCTNPNVDLC